MCVVSRSLACLEANFDCVTGKQRKRAHMTGQACAFQKSRQPAEQPGWPAQITKGCSKKSKPKLRSAYCCDKHDIACDHAALGCDRLCDVFGEHL